ncbi:hypothetical protein EVAR_68523_1 [Eumeta japonica]|uniref:Cuticle protein 6 n=1 Tax=Eumeta variegata TaxID=151549 RepID=A0A4C1ZG12_EUMVA|nr:hypothetical protein EVAR_68523_1 [Eumeta japonica]
MLALLYVACAAHAQYVEDRQPRYIASESRPAPTPVPILKQINRHNEDGSYTYGYEAADGSFKIETKSPAGEVKGKYGYKDDTGKVRVIEYGANKFGFQPAGEGITVAPPTLVDETTREEGLRPKQNQASRSQYRAPPPAAPPAQSLDYDYDEPRPAPPPRQQYRPAPQPQQAYRAPAPAQPAYRPPAPAQAAPRPPKPAFFAGAAPAPEPGYFRPEPQQQYRPEPQQHFRPEPQQHFRSAQKQEFQTVSQHLNPQPAQFRPKPQIDYSQTIDFPPNSGPQAFPPQQNSAPIYSQKPSKNTQSFSMLDQLLKEYALPQGGAAPLHDITFGSY